MRNNILHVHSDTHLLHTYYKIPAGYIKKSDVYILQENRLVFIGSVKNAEFFLKENEGKYCNNRFPIIKYDRQTNRNL
jgi:hypothetical protein